MRRFGSKSIILLKSISNVFLHYWQKLPGSKPFFPCYWQVGVTRRYWACASWINIELMNTPEMSSNVPVIQIVRPARIIFSKFMYESTPNVINDQEASYKNVIDSSISIRGRVYRKKVQSTWGIVLNGPTPCWTPRSVGPVPPVHPYIMVVVIGESISLWTGSG